MPWGCCLQGTMFSRCSQKHSVGCVGEELGWFGVWWWLFVVRVLCLCFCGIFIAKWFDRVCLLGTACYKQINVFVYNQTNHTGVFKRMRGNGAFTGFFLVCDAEVDFNGKANQQQNFCWGRSTQFIDFRYGCCPWLFCKIDALYSLCAFSLIIISLYILLQNSAKLVLSLAYLH